MFIKTIEIEGACGDVEISRTPWGVVVLTKDHGQRHAFRSKMEVSREATKEARRTAAVEAAKTLLGVGKDGVPFATNSMIDDILREIDRVIGL